MNEVEMYDEIYNKSKHFKIEYETSGIKHTVDLIETNFYIKLLKQYCELQQENKQLKKQLDYLLSGEYLNQLKFERNMLQELVDNKEVSKEDKEFIDMTRRNTKLLEQLKQSEEVIEEAIKFINNARYDKELKTIAYGGLNVSGINNVLDILNKYKKEESE